MKKRNGVAVILVIILGSFSFWFIINNHNGTIKQTLKDFAVEDTASVTKIFLANKSGEEITLERKPGSSWMVNGNYPARIDAIQGLMQTIRKVDVKEPVGKNAQDYVVKRLSAKAIRCEIYQNNKLTKAYYVGTETQDMTGTYMILIDLETMKPSEKPFVTYIPGFEGYLTTRYFTDEKAWRDRTVYHYNPSEIKSVRMEVPFKPNESYEVSALGNNHFQVQLLSDKHPLAHVDTLAIKQYLSYFQHLNFEAFEGNLNQHQVDSVLKSQPLNILTVTDNKGNTNKVTFFARKPKKEGLLDEKGNTIVVDAERMDALLNNGKDFVVLQYYVFGKVLVPVDYFSKGY